MIWMNKHIQSFGQGSDTTPIWTFVRQILEGVGMTAVMCWTIACSNGPKYFQDALNEATQEMVFERHGHPHRVQPLEDGGQQWTYFERGSGIATYSGPSRGGLCRAYVLSFDAQRVLRGWQQQPCQG
jgi:hypothetical protein